MIVRSVKLGTLMCGVEWNGDGYWYVCYSSPEFCLNLLRAWLVVSWYLLLNTLKMRQI